jgi:glycosyltransferase involved in cell wall biosynthesis
MSATRRILFVDQFGTLGGGQRMLAGMVRRGVEKGWTVMVALPDGPLGVELSESGATVMPLDVPQLADGSKGGGDVAALMSSMPRLLGQFREAVEHGQPEVVHVNGGRVLVPAVLARLRPPLTFHAHTLMEGASARVSRYLLRSRRVKRVISPSGFMERWVETSLNVEPGRITTVSNWVDPSFGSAVAGESANPPREAGSPLVFAVVGRVTAIKGQSQALAAVLDARGAGADIVLWLAGDEDPEYVAGLVEQASGDPGALEVLGRCEDVAELLGRVDVAIVPSLWAEPFGLAAAEAMAAGVPVVAYASGALPEVVGDSGVLVETGDVDALSTAIRRLADDADERHRLALAGAERARTHFSYERQTDALYEVFESVARGA